MFGLSMLIWYNKNDEHIYIYYYESIVRWIVIVGICVVQAIWGGLVIIVVRIMNVYILHQCEEYVCVEFELYDLRLKGVESLRYDYSCDNYIYVYTYEIWDWKG